MKDSVETEDTAPPKENRNLGSLLDCFPLLKHDNKKERVTGGTKLISLLQESENKDHRKYVVKRLVRSLGANNPDNRTGYFATLVTALTRFPAVTVTELLQLVRAELHANGSSKSEVGDVALGQILVCGAIFRSGLMLKCDKEDQKQTIELLFKASTKKSYLGTVAYLILLDFVVGLDEEAFSSVVWSNVKQGFKMDLKEHSLDSLYFLLKVSSKFPKKVKLRKLIGAEEVLCEDNIHTVCEKLMAGIDFNTISHPIFKEVGTVIANSPHLGLFWTSGIDSQLAKHNRNRELVALNLLHNILNNMDTNFEIIPELLSKNFFKLFMDWFKGLQTASKMRKKRDDEEDHKIMIKKQKEVLNALAKVLKKDTIDPKIRVATLRKLLFSPGEMNFTDITGTNVDRSIISDLDVNGVKKLAKQFKSVLLNTSKKVIKEGVERNWFNNERQRAAEYISYLVNHETVKDDAQFKLSHMTELMCLGFFKMGEDETVVISNELAVSVKSCFYRCFRSRFTNVDSLVEVLHSLSEFITKTMTKDSVKEKLDKQFPKENMECWEMVTELSERLYAKNKKSKVDNVFLILLYQLGLFLFSEPDHVKMAKSSIKELKSCHEHYKTDKKNKPKKASEGEEEDPEWIDVLVEVLLSILSTESSVLRSVVQCVFRLLSEYLTPTSIEQIVSVLDPESDSNPLTRDGDSEDENDSEDSDKDGGESDEEKSEKASDESDSEVEDIDDGDTEMKVPEQLRLAVQKALGADADSDNESIDADMIDEEQGKKLDDALAEAFKQFHQGKGKKSKKERKDKKTLSDFRIRVLDLVDIYLEKDPPMSICLSVIAPLLRALEFCIQDNQFAELEKRLRKSIRLLTKIKKFSSNDDVTLDVLCGYFKATVEKGSRSQFMFQALGDVLTQLATFMIHCSQRIDTTATPKKKKAQLTEILKQTLTNFFQNRNCLLPVIFFHNVLQLEWEGNYDLIAVVIENAFDTTTRQFRRNQALDLVSGFYRHLLGTKPTDEQTLSRIANLEALFECRMKTALERGDYASSKKSMKSLKMTIRRMQLLHSSCKSTSGLDFPILLDIVQKKADVLPKSKPISKEKNAVENGVEKKRKRKKNKKNKGKVVENGQRSEMNGNGPRSKKPRRQSNDENGQQSEMNGNGPRSKKPRRQSNDENGQRSEMNGNGPRSKKPRRQSNDEGDESSS